MKMSIFFIALSAAIGVGMWFLVIGIIFSIGGGDLFKVTHYDSLFFNITIFLLCIVIYLFFARHLLEKKMQLLLLICVATTILFFFLTPWLIESKSSLNQKLSNISFSNHEKFMEKVDVLIEQEHLPYRVNIDKSRERFKEIRNVNVVVLNKTTNEEIKKNDVDGLLGLTYGEDVRLKVFNKSNERLLIDFVIDIDKSISFCDPYKVCGDLGLEIK
ncbi:hypothetical protein [Paenibacillus graminis]|uniref:Uncharacterized protein n=1 Tax=Paenibacillus graminis TaxID=189425 RepID=A0A089MEY7_9BACL|nr:hypothetical protein [Paenibacillus graminis]AIQ70920.1 hypothetical protein PGRAT_27310 [Paenibacillus graminis]